MCPTSMRRCPGRRAVLAPNTARSKCGRSGKCSLGNVVLGDVAAMHQGGSDKAGAVAEVVARSSYGKLVAYLAARTRDVAAAEDALADAFTAALSDWPAAGVPDHPEAWLMTVARRRLIDAARRRRHAEDGVDHVRLLMAEMEAAAEANLPDHRLA